jgi:hypothetical protein
MRINLCIYIYISIGGTILVIPSAVEEVCTVYIYINVYIHIYIHIYI